MSKYLFDMDKIYPDKTDSRYNIPGVDYRGNNCMLFQYGIYEVDRNHDFKKHMKAFARANPDVMQITKHGNGANVNVGGLHIGSQGCTTVAFNMPNTNVWFRMSYSSIQSIEIDTDNKLVVINGKVALHYESSNP